MNQRLVVGLVFFALFCFVGNDGLAKQAESTLDRRPNIILINLDDCDVDLVSDTRLKQYPNLAALADASTRFTNCHVTTPLCGPSRACLFRSQYAHNTGYRTNRPNLDAGSGFTGGTQYFQDSGLAADQLPVWMNDAGYHTMLVGKYYQGATKPVPVPGWDRFIAYGGNTYLGKITRFDIRPDGKTEILPIEGYRTKLETDEVVDLLDEYSKNFDASQPFFLYLAPVAPHVGPLDEDPVPNQWRDRFLDVKIATDPSFNEDDVSDKPVAYRDKLKLSEDEIEALRVTQRRRLIAMLGVDEMVNRIRNKVAEIGQEDNTIVILTSDHGYLMGQHRMHGKSFPLIEATRVPLWVHWPGTSKPRDADHLLAHIDIAATVAKLGGARLPAFVDGRSFVQLLQNDAIVERNAIRNAVLVENWESRLNSMSRRKIVYSSMIENDQIFTHWATGEKEFYNLNDDPHQLENAYKSLSLSTQQGLENELRSLRRRSSTYMGSTATLSFPTVTRKFVGPDTTLEGFVESSSQSDAVEFSIQRSSSGEFWNGFEWQQQLVNLPTVTSPEPGLLREWRAVPKLAAVKPGETLKIKVHSKNEAPRKSSIRELNVVFDNEPPSVRISRPLMQFAYPAFSNFGGLITDDQASDNVKVSVLDIDRKKYFDGENWIPAKRYVSVKVNTRLGRWHAIYPLPAGRYQVDAIGQDAAGNWSDPCAAIRFVVDPKLKQRKKLGEPIE